MTRKIFLNLPTRDLATCIEFFRGLGFEFNAQFTNDNAACMIVNDHALVMFLTEPFFSSFMSKEICDTATAAETMVALTADSRERVDEIVNQALATGGQPAGTAMDQGFMYGWSFQDPDGHLWEVVWMDPAVIS